jgi:hypothetical protein
MGAAETFGILHSSWLRQQPRLFLPVIAGGAVFEGKQFAEGAEIIVVPLGDLAPGADTEGVELITEHAFDAFDLGEVVVGLVGEVGGLLKGFEKGTVLVLQGLDGGLGFGKTLGAAGEAAAGETEPGEIRRSLRFEHRDTALPIVPLLRERGEDGKLRREGGFDLRELFLGVVSGAGGGLLLRGARLGRGFFDFGSRSEGRCFC